MPSLRDLFVGITFQDHATGAVNRLNRSMDTAENNARNMGNEIQHTEKKTSVFSSTIKKVGGIVAGAFAVDKIKEFGISMIENAASAQAMNAQFAQVFGKTQKDAQKTVNSLGKQFGMVPNRIKPAMSQMTSMFKGLGISTNKSMGLAKNAVTLTADAAAFYDKSFEDANAALNSFIKGNYEGGESIGLFANETQLASWAAKNLHLNWKKLDEAGKQTARLKFAEAMQKAAGATGQARRESKSYENQLGNIKQAWADFKAKLGGNLLGPAVTGLQNLSTWIQKIDVKKIENEFRSFGSYIGDTFGPVLTDFKGIASGVWNVFKDNGGIETTKSALNGVKTGLSWIKDNSEVITASVLGLAGGFAAFKILTGINSAVKVFNALMIGMRTGTLMATLAQYGLNTAMLANPFTWVAVGIGAVIAAGVLLWKNWDKVSVKMKGVWNDIQLGASHMVNGVIGGINWMIKLINKLPGVDIPTIGKVSWGKSKKEESQGGINGSGAVNGAWLKAHGYANGTGSHPGGLAVVGDGKGSNAGSELFRLPNGQIGLTPSKPTIIDLPRGTQVIDAKTTKKLMAGLVPAYAGGIISKAKSALATGWGWLKDKLSNIKNSAINHVMGLVGGNIGSFVSFPKALVSMVNDSLFKHIKSTFGIWLGKGRASTAQVRNWIAAAIGITGISPKWLGALSTLAMKESGGNPRAINLWDSNAKAGHPSKGLMQTIDSTFNAYKISGMNDIWNPIHNAVAAIRYMVGRYGSIGNVPGIRNMAQGKGYVGYAKGGTVPHTQTALVGENGPELVKLPGGTRVYNNQATRKMASRPINYNPVVNIEVNASNASASDIKRAVKQALDEQYRRLLTIFSPEEVY